MDKFDIGLQVTVNGYTAEAETRRVDHTVQERRYYTGTIDVGGHEVAFHFECDGNYVGVVTLMDCVNTAERYEACVAACRALDASIDGSKA